MNIFIGIHMYLLLSLCVRYHAVLSEVQHGTEQPISAGT